jgi:membrane associated rhomboid family serine protease
VFSRFHHWDVVALLAAMAVVFGFEMLGIFNPNYCTITALVRAYFPRWLRAMLLGWLCWHFLSK